jgi:hypothetical protein
MYVQVHVVDVFAMPQSGTSVTVESVDHVFQTKMLDMLKQTGRSVPLPPILTSYLRRAYADPSSCIDRRWSLAGIIPTQVLVAGSLPSM